MVATTVHRGLEPGQGSVGQPIREVSALFGAIREPDKKLLSIIGACCFCCLKGTSKPVPVLVHGIEAVMLLTLIILK